MTYTKNLCMEAEIEGKKHFFMNYFLITEWMVLRELHKGTSLEILTAGQVWQG